MCGYIRSCKKGVIINIDLAIQVVIYVTVICIKEKEILFRSLDCVDILEDCQKGVIDVDLAIQAVIHVIIICITEKERSSV